MPKNETAADSRQPITLKWKLRKALEENVAPRDDGKGLDFGADVGVDGKLHLNALSDIVGPSGDALFTDDTQENVSTLLDTLLDTYFVRKFAGASFNVDPGAEGQDSLLSPFQSLIDSGKCAYFSECFAHASAFITLEATPTVLTVADFPTSADVHLEHMFNRFKGVEGGTELTVRLGNGHARISSMFIGWRGNEPDGYSCVTAVDVEEGKAFQPFGAADNVFYGNTRIKSVSGIDFSQCTRLNSVFVQCTSLASIDCTGWSVSFDVSDTALGHDALVHLIDTLETVSAAQTLTMGDAKLALLSDEEKLGATNKGWTLA